MKKLDMFDVITHRCRGTSLVSCKHYLLKRSTLFLICCIRADEDMQEHQQNRDKLQQSTLQAWRRFHEFPMLVNSSPRRSIRMTPHLTLAGESELRPRCPALLGWSVLAGSELEDVHLC